LKPTLEQANGILNIVKEKNAVIQSEPGTGKTTALAISILQLIDTSISHCQVIVFMGHQEFSIQTQNIIKALGEFLSVKACTYNGDAEVKKDITKPEVEGHVIIGTPDKVYDLLQKDALKVEHLKLLVFDGIDEMLELGYKDNIYDFLQEKPRDTKIVLSTTTISSQVLELKKYFMKEAVKIEKGSKNLSLEEVKQYYIMIEEDEWKFDTLLDIFLEIGSFSQCVIYCNKAENAKELAEKLEEKDFMVTCIVSDLVNLINNMILAW